MIAALVAAVDHAVVAASAGTAVASFAVAEQVDAAADVAVVIEAVAAVVTAVVIEAAVDAAVVVEAAGPIALASASVFEPVQAAGVEPMEFDPSVPVFESVFALEPVVVVGEPVQAPAIAGPIAPGLVPELANSAAAGPTVPASGPVPAHLIVPVVPIGLPVHPADQNNPHASRLPVVRSAAVPAVYKISHPENNRDAAQVECT